MHLFLIAATPALRLGPPVMQLNEFSKFSGGASPFAPFKGTGSAGDHSRWANGGDWWQRPTDEAGAVVTTATEVGEKKVRQIPAVDPACGGASPMAPWMGTGSAGDHSRWANGGDWWQRPTDEAGGVVTTATEVGEKKVRQVPVVDPACGGASPFAPFNGSGSVGDHSKWASGGDWWQRSITTTAAGRTLGRAVRREGVVVASGSKVDEEESPAEQKEEALAEEEEEEALAEAAEVA